MFIETCLDEEPRTYTTQQLASHLYEHRQVKLSVDRLGQFSQKDLVQEANAPWTAAASSP